MSAFGRRVCLLAGVALLAFATNGCAFRELREQRVRAEALCRISGTVRSAEATESTFVVVLMEHRDGDAARIADHFVVERAGAWHFLTTPGTYTVGAFEDRNGDGKLQPDESVRLPQDGRVHRLEPGARVTDVELVIAPGERAPIDAPLDIAALQARTPADQLDWSLGRLTVVGEVVPLEDPRFDRARAEEGLWRPLDFLARSEAGVYFTEPYDAERVPVLFVHGILGSPRGFSALAANLDAERFQPWFYYYPSGVALDKVAEHLSQVLVSLSQRHRFEQLYIVAHSMGGLAARAFVLRHAAETDRRPVRLFVTMSTPWGGQSGAAHAVRAERRGLPIAPAWRDVAPESDFLTRLFYGGENRIRLPDRTPFHLIFGYERRSRRPGRSSDGVVDLASQLRLEAQQEARSVFGIDAGHAAILEHPLTSERLNAILRASPAP